MSLRRNKLCERVVPPLPPAKQPPGGAVLLSEWVAARIHWFDKKSRILLDACSDKKVLRKRLEYCSIPAREWQFPIQFRAL